MCIEDHKFQPRNFWNGRWRSEWHIKPSGDVSAVLRVQVHYYEDGNVQLQSNKEVSNSVPKGDGAGMAQKLFKLVLDAENEYQVKRRKWEKSNAALRVPPKPHASSTFCRVPRLPSRRTTTPCPTRPSRRCGERCR